ncbi:MAG TPA: hypothetical protein VM118_11655 [Acidobacteriota bacterium]|nr:hypothetical protein [Acidobacteriota bacterium]
MSLGSTAVLDGLLKDYYDDEWVKSGVNDLHPLKDIIEEKMMDKKYGGRRVMYGHHVSRNKSPFATGEYGLFAEADVQGHIDITVEARKMMGRTILTPEAIADTADSAMAWEDAEENNFDRLVIDLARRDELMLSYDGRGVLGRINAADPDAATTVAVDSPGGVTGSTFGNRFFRVGENVAAINPATGGIRAVVSPITAVSADGTTITGTNIGSATAWADNDYLVKAANATVTDPLDTEYEHWFWGLLGIFDDGTYRGNYGGGDRTLWNTLNTYVNASTGALSVDTLQMLSDVMDQRSGGITSLMLCHHSVRRLYIKLTQADRRYSGEDLRKPDAGTLAFKQGDITMGEVPIKAIRDFPYGVLLGMDVEMAKLRRYVSTKGEWVKDGDGRVLVRSGTGSTARDAFEAWYRMRYQYWAKVPSAAWRADGITGATVTIARPLGD